MVISTAILGPGELQISLLPLDIVPATTGLCVGVSFLLSLSANLNKCITGQCITGPILGCIISVNWGFCLHPIYVNVSDSEKAPISFCARLPRPRQPVDLLRP